MALITRHCKPAEHSHVPTLLTETVCVLSEGQQILVYLPPVNEHNSPLTSAQRIHYLSMDAMILPGTSHNHYLLQPLCRNQSVENKGEHRCITGVAKV